MDLLVLSMAKKYVHKFIPSVTIADNGKVLSANNGTFVLRPVDSVATENSTNLITSGAVYSIVGEVEEELAEV